METAKKTLAALLEEVPPEGKTAPRKQALFKKRPVERMENNPMRYPLECSRDYYQEMRDDHEDAVRDWFEQRERRRNSWIVVRDVPPACKADAPVEVKKEEPVKETDWQNYVRLQYPSECNRDCFQELIMEEHENCMNGGRSKLRHEFRVNKTSMVQNWINQGEIFIKTSKDIILEAPEPSPSCDTPETDPSPVSEGTENQQPQSQPET